MSFKIIDGGGLRSVGAGRALVENLLPRPLAAGKDVMIGDIDATCVNFSFVFTEIMIYPSHPASVRGAYRGRHEREAGSGGRAGAQHPFEGADERVSADGEVVWS